MLAMHYCIPLQDGEPSSRITALDPRDGGHLTVLFDTATPGRQFEIMYTAQGAAPLADWPSR